MNSIPKSCRGVGALGALVATALLCVASLMVFQASYSTHVTTGFGDSARNAQDLLDQRVVAWRAGEAVTAEDGTLASGAFYRLSVEEKAVAGIAQLRLEITWSEDPNVPAPPGTFNRLAALAIKQAHD